MHEINPQQHPAPLTELRASQLQPPVVKNPVYYYVLSWLIEKGHEKYNWRLEELEPVSIIDHLQTEPFEF
jgi:hypothetical protein